MIGRRNSTYVPFLLWDKYATVNSRLNRLMILWPLLAKLEVLRQACLFTRRAVSGRKNLTNLDQLPSRFNVLLMEDIQCIFPFFCGTNTDQLLTRSFSLCSLFTRWRRPCPWSFVGFGFKLALLTPSWARGMT
jgi:hypothetical protein